MISSSSWKFSLLACCLGVCNLAAAQSVAVAVAPVSVGGFIERLDEDSANDVRRAISGCKKLTLVEAADRAALTVSVQRTVEHTDGAFPTYFNMLKVNVYATPKAPDDAAKLFGALFSPQLVKPIYRSVGWLEWGAAAKSAVKDLCKWVEFNRARLKATG